jgi:hypothetical protein
MHNVMFSRKGIIYKFFLTPLFLPSVHRGLPVHVWYCQYKHWLLRLDMMSRVPVNTLHFMQLPYEVHIKRICVSNQVGRIVWAVSVSVLPVGWVLVDLGEGVVYPYGWRCASWLLLGRLVWADRRVGCGLVRATVRLLLVLTLYFESVVRFLC